MADAVTPTQSSSDPADTSSGVAFVLIAENWRRCSAAGVSSESRENWRWTQPVLGIGLHNQSLEVVIERALAAAPTVHRPGKWWVQMPMVSGVAGPNADRRRALDLVHAVNDRHLALIELKVASNTPLLAAFGAWLPDPLMGATDPRDEPVAEDLTFILMLALERLSPLERAAFLLHDVSGMTLADAATTLDRGGSARSPAGRN